MAKTGYSSGCQEGRLVVFVGITDCVDGVVLELLILLVDKEGIWEFQLWYVVDQASVDIVEECVLKGSGVNKIWERCGKKRLGEKGWGT